jgi:hypothetical protein
MIGIGGTETIGLPPLRPPSISHEKATLIVIFAIAMMNVHLRNNQ